jgi:hypothetical protein
MGKRSSFVLALASILVTLTMSGPSVALSQDISVSVDKSVLGQTTQYIGATEGGFFNVDDLTDCGINTYRIWIGMSDVEYCDDDDPRGYVWECDPAGNTQYGLPISDTIKVNPDVIDWEDWDAHINDPSYRWRTGQNPDTAYGDMVEQLIAEDVLPVLCLRNRDEFGWPNWSPDPPFDEDALNEWWQYCFAVAYWFNVRNGYGVTHFEIHNEPDLPDQGWHGTQGQYADLVRVAHDAITTANDMAGIDTVILAPVESQCPFPRTYSYFAEVFDNADSLIDVADFHWYHMNGTYPLGDLQAAIDDVAAQLTAHNPDGAIEPLWVSEYGNFSSPCTYDTLDEAMRTARQLLLFSREGIQGVNIFPFYDWGTTCGLVTGDGGKTETYYAYRLLARALAGGKDCLDFEAEGAGDEVMVTRDLRHIYVIVINGDGTVSVDLSELGVPDGTAIIREYSPSHKDEITGTAAISDGQFSFTAPASGIAVAEIPFTISYLPLIAQGR